MIRYSPPVVSLTCTFPTLFNKTRSKNFQMGIYCFLIYLLSISELRKKNSAALQSRHIKKTETHFEFRFAESDLFFYQLSKYANIKGTTIVASLSTIYFGVSIPSLPQVIFSFGT